MKIQIGETVDFGLVKLKKISATDSEECIAIYGISPNPIGLEIATHVSDAYISGQQCRCGDNWEQLSMGSNYPIDEKICSCESCNAEKKFEFFLE